MKIKMACSEISPSLSIPQRASNSQSGSQDQPSIREEFKNAAIQAPAPVWGWGQELMF